MIEGKQQPSASDPNSNRLASRNMFTVLLPVKDTPEERQYLTKSLPAIFRLGAGEVIIALDAPVATELSELIMSIARKHNNEDSIRLLAVEKSSDWNFQLAKVTWTAYKAAKYDKIFATNNDSIVRKVVMKGFDRVGKDGVAVYSFTLGLRRKNLSDLIRYAFYRYRVWASDYVFAGNYWIYRPYFFGIIDEKVYRSITNGVDTYLTQRIIEEKTEFRIITDKAIGVNCMTVQNEDYPWRQWQKGIWLGANFDRWTEERMKMRELRRKTSVQQRDNRSKRGSMSKSIFFVMEGLTNRLLDNPATYVFVKTFMYQHPFMMKGYKWARANPDHEIVKIARTMPDYEWYYNGGKYMKMLDFVSVEGTGA